MPDDNAFFPYADAKLAADQHLRGTGLDWTILGPGALTDAPATGAVALDPPYGEVSRGTVAQVVVATLRIPETVHRLHPLRRRRHPDRGRPAGRVTGSPAPRGGVQVEASFDPA